MQETVAALAGVLDHLRPTLPQAIAGLPLRGLDGNFLAGTEHRLGDLRGCGAAAWPGLSLVVREGTSGLLTEVIPCADAYTNERSLAGEVLPLVGANDLWLADRNFCTADYLGGIASRQAFFLVRHHKGTHLHPQGSERYVGKNATGELYEVQVPLCGLVCRCSIIRLFKPLRDGTTALRLLTNVPVNKAGGKHLAELYRTRMADSTAFQELTDNLRLRDQHPGLSQSGAVRFCPGGGGVQPVGVRAAGVGVRAGEPGGRRHLKRLPGQRGGDGFAGVGHRGARGHVAAFGRLERAGTSPVGCVAWWSGSTGGRIARAAWAKETVAVGAPPSGAAHRSTARVLNEKGHKT